MTHAQAHLASNLFHAALKLVTDDALKPLAAKTFVWVKQKPIFPGSRVDVVTHCPGGACSLYIIDKPVTTERAAVRLVKHVLMLAAEAKPQTADQVAAFTQLTRKLNGVRRASALLCESLSTLEKVLEAHGCELHGDIVVGECTATIPVRCSKVANSDAEVRRLSRALCAAVRSVTGANAKLGYGSFNGAAQTIQLDFSALKTD